MKPKFRLAWHPWFLVSLAGAACGSVCAADEEAKIKTYSLKLVKAVEGPNTAKPAELFFNREDAASNTLLNAAVLLRDVTLPGVAGVVDNSWGLSAGVSKNTLSTKRTDALTLGTGIYSRWSESADRKRSIDTSLDLLLENDRENRTRGRAFILDLTARNPLLYDPQIDPGQVGTELRFSPSVGLYGRRVSSTDDEAAAPVGTHGGAYVGARLTARVRWSFPTPKVPLFDRVSLNLFVRYTRDSSVSEGYGKASYRFAEASIDYLLFGDPSSTGLKPTLSLSRTRGTDRPANEPHQDKSSIGFKVSYGI